ncbi:hypothetical protein D3C73_1490200 [compost metagenome]
MAESFLGSGVGASVGLADACGSVDAAGSAVFLSELQPVSDIKAAKRPMAMVFFILYFPLPR